MAFETKDYTGTLFRNDKRDPNNPEDKQPNMKGKALIAGIWYWVSAWTKDGKSGKYQSLQFEEMSAEQVAKYCSGNGTGGQQRQQQAPQRQQPQQRRQQPTRQQQQPIGSQEVFEEEDVPF